MTLVLEDTSHKLTIATAAPTTAPPVTPTDGQDMSAWRAGGTYSPRRCAVRFTAAGALTLSAISIWVFYAGAWSKISKPADITFVAGDLSFTVIVDFPIGSRIAAAFTVSASSVTVEAFPMESVIC